MTKRPKAILVTHREGGEWLAFPSKRYSHDRSEGILVHSITFDDGSIWDACNGWRPIPERPKRNIFHRMLESLIR
jgi:hypothetical protein